MVGRISCSMPLQQSVILTHIHVSFSTKYRDSIGSFCHGSDQVSREIHCKQATAKLSGLDAHKNTRCLPTRQADRNNNITKFPTSTLRTSKACVWRHGSSLICPIDSARPSHHVHQNGAHSLPESATGDPRTCLRVRLYAEVHRGRAKWHVVLPACC